MPIDLLVPLYSLPPREEGAASVRDAGIVIRRANPFERTRVQEFAYAALRAKLGR